MTAALESEARPRKPLGLGILTMAGLLSLALYLGLAILGDLRAHLGLYLAAHGALFALYALVVRLLVRTSVPAPAAGESAPADATSASPPAESSRRGLSHTTARAQGEGAPESRFERAFSGPDGNVACVSPLKNGGGQADPSRPGAPRRRLPRLVSPGVLLALFAVAFRAAFLFTPASLSDDMYRYVWDGRVQARGINPYRHAPDAEELRPLRDASWEKINHREVPTIYAPLTEAVFFLSASAGCGQIGLKAIFCLLDLALCVALIDLLRRNGKAPWLAAVYAWNPLVVIEVASSGHADPLAVFFLVLSVCFIIRERSGMSLSALALSAAARLFPVVLLPAYSARARGRHLLAGAALLGLSFAPYAHVGSRMFAGLTTYAENWDYNSVVFPALRWILERCLPGEALKGLITQVKGALGDPAWSEILYRLAWPATLARGLLFVALVAGVFSISARVSRVERELLLAISLLLVLSPTLHPWYLLWVLPFAALEMSTPWILFSALAPLSYLSLRAPDGRCPVWVLALEWGAPAALVLFTRLRRRS